MTTEAQFADPAFKKLLSNEDLRERLVEYLREYVRENMERVFSDDGTFGPSKMTLAGLSPNVVRVSPTGLRIGADGAGHILDVGFLGVDTEFSGKIKDFQIENTNAVLYHVAYQFTPIPRGIVINPRNGMPQYAYNIEGIGRRAEPDAVTDNGNGTITFDINTVCDGAGHSYAGRRALVFLKTPAKDAILESIALETLTITWNGVNNRVTTVAALGQSVISTNPADYEVVMLGPTVTKVDPGGLSGYWYIGNIVGVGAGGTPGAGSNTNQNLIDTSLSTFINYPGGPSWADGTINGPTTITNQLTKIITDLTSTTGQRGAGKLTAPAFSAWADGTANPATRLDLAIGKIITDLNTTAGNGGADRIGIGARTQWDVGDTNPATRTYLAINKIITDLLDQVGASNSGRGGGGRIGIGQMGNQFFDGLSPGPGTIYQVFDQIVDHIGFNGQDAIGILSALPTWLGGRTNPGGVSLYDALAKIINDLGAQTAGDDGAERIGAQAIGNLSAGSVRSQLSELDTEKGGLALANIWSGASSSNDFRRFILIGSDLNSTAADRDTTRIDFDINLTSNTRTRIMDFGRLGGGTHRTILYIVAGDGGVTFELAQNALWSNTTLLWTKEKNAVSHLWRLRANGGFERWREQNATAGATWSDVYGVGSGGWEFRQLDYIADVSGTTINSSRWRIHNGKIQFTDSRDANDANATNPDAAQAPRENTLYAKNIVKAWGKFFGATTTPSVDDGFNVTAAYSGNNLVVTYGTAVSGNFRQAHGGLMVGTSTANAGWLTVTGFLTTGITISAWRISAGAVVQVNLNGSNLDFSFIMCGRQTSTT
jgi:hypothetical protein